MLRDVNWYLTVAAGALAAWFSYTTLAKSDSTPNLSAVIIIALVFAGIVAFTSAPFGAGKRIAKEALEGPGGTLAGIEFTKSKITYGSESQPIAGVQASVETAGSISRYPDVANMAIGGALFGRAGVLFAANDKKVDDRELYVYIRGTRHQWVAQVHPNLGEVARKFASRVNSAALTAANASGQVRGGSTGTVAAQPKPHAQPSAPKPSGIAEELRTLNDLHKAGALTDEEFEAAKQRALEGEGQPKQSG